MDAAARAARADDIVAALPDGYDTVLSRTHADDGERAGVTLSGGQWQRVALARCLMRTDAELIVLDEPTSGLDAEGEHRVHSTLRRHTASTPGCSASRPAATPAPSVRRGDRVPGGGRATAAPDQAGRRVAGDPLPDWLVPTLPDLSHVPAGHVAVVGDNTRSQDSRHLGLIDCRGIVGTVPCASPRSTSRGEGREPRPAL
ncbi:ATP-binding cassette domain-containing protein [Nonomuraea montanisoli]|uniref:ATP-binding cassette domain-containing protein n=1 Tax=Nonomuraea montanisoli TaxID=2741721 RepID=UPI002E2E0503|nr:ATP-binding cassette domain-containing protein [Nonomuraea montanisoli]